MDDTSRGVTTNKHAPVPFAKASCQVSKTNHVPKTGPHILSTPARRFQECRRGLQPKNSRQSSLVAVYDIMPAQLSCRSQNPVRAIFAKRRPLKLLSMVMPNLPRGDGLFEIRLDRRDGELKRAVFVRRVQLAVGLELAEHQLRQWKTRGWLHETCFCHKAEVRVRTSEPFLAEGLVSIF